MARIGWEIIAKRNRGFFRSNRNVQMTVVSVAHTVNRVKATEPYIRNTNYVAYELSLKAVLKSSNSSSQILITFYGPGTVVSSSNASSRFYNLIYSNNNKTTFIDNTYCTLGTNPHSNP